MNNTEEQHPVFIPRNFIEKGTFMGGMFKIRNAIEGGVLAILITIPVINLPLTLTVRIIILCMTALPAAMISLIGIGGESEVNLYETETNPLPILRQHRNFKGCVLCIWK